MGGAELVLPDHMGDWLVHNGPNQYNIYGKIACSTILQNICKCELLAGNLLMQCGNADARLCLSSTFEYCAPRHPCLETLMV